MVVRARWCRSRRDRQEQGDKLKIAKVNVDEAGELAQRYGVMSIPTLLVFAAATSKSSQAHGRCIGKAKLLEDLGVHRSLIPR